MTEGENKVRKKKRRSGREKKVKETGGLGE